VAGKAAVDEAAEVFSTSEISAQSVARIGLSESEVDQMDFRSDGKMGGLVGVVHPPAWMIEATGACARRGFR